MEDLQDACEDSQFVNAMGDGPPLPTAEFPVILPSTIDKWKATKPKEMFEPFALVSQRLGFYLFMRYLVTPKAKGGGGEVAKAMFLVGVAKFAKLAGASQLKQCAETMKSDFLTGGVTYTKGWDIDKSGLVRDLAQAGTITAGAAATLADSTIGKGADNALTASGSILDECKAAIPNKVDGNTFQKLEAAVFGWLIKHSFHGFQASGYYNKLLGFLLIQGEPVSESDFNALRVLGRGGFGLVNGTKKATTGKLYAMKTMNKRRVKMNKCEQLTINERVALAEIDSPFVVTLSYAFTSDMELFLCLEMMTGGDLSFHLKQKTRFSKPESLYFAARILLGVQAFHDHDFVYRDLKPENILMGDDGRVKITDLGLACKIVPSLKGAAGTRGYWGPEMLRRGADGKKMGYDHMVDWFSYGCMLAEFISGVSPFRSDAALYWSKTVNRSEKGWQVKALDDATENMDPTWDMTYFTDDAADLCTKLTMKFAKDRIGYNNGSRKDGGGAKEIMAHPYFKTIDWDMIKKDLHTPPFIPAKDVNAASQESIGEFKDAGLPDLDQKDQDFYSTWSWTNERSFQDELVDFLIYEQKQGKVLIPAKGGCVLL